MSSSSPTADTEAFNAVQDFLSENRTDYIAFGIPPPRFLLLSGPPGVGKTHAAHHVTLQLNVDLHVITPGPHASILLIRAINATKKKKNGHRRQNKISSTSDKKKVIFIDEIDEVCPSTISSTTTEILCQLLDDDTNESNIYLIAATNRPAAVHTRLLRACRLDKHVVLSPPNAKERLRVLLSLCPSYVDDSVLRTVALTQTHGFVTADLADLVHHVSDAVAIDSNEKSTAPTTFEQALLSYSNAMTPSTLRSSIATSVSITPPSKASWDEIAGGTEAKNRLRIAIEWPIKHTATFKRLGLKSSRGGILLNGPPGCAKTSLVRIAASIAKLPFLRLTSADIFSAFVGDSERVIRDAFTAARACAPCILFMDEVDAIAGKRGSDGEKVGVGERVLASLLTEMDGVQGGLDGVVVVAATNRIDVVDEALLRPGRFDDIIFVGLPDENERLDILKMALGDGSGSRVKLGKDVDLQLLARASDGCSGAEVKRVCAEAVMSAVRESLDCKDVDDIEVDRCHFVF